MRCISHDNLYIINISSHRVTVSHSLRIGDVFKAIHNNFKVLINRYLQLYNSF